MKWTNFPGRCTVFTDVWICLFVTDIRFADWSLCATQPLGFLSSGVYSHVLILQNTILKWFWNVLRVWFYKTPSSTAFDQEYDGAQNPWLHSDVTFLSMFRVHEQSEVLFSTGMLQHVSQDFPVPSFSNRTSVCKSHQVWRPDLMCCGLDWRRSIHVHFISL